MLNQLYREEMRVKEKMIKHKCMLDSILDRYKIPVLSSGRKLHTAPFRPSSSNVRVSPIDEKRQIMRSSGHQRSLRSDHIAEEIDVVDAETGELIALTTAKWNGIEGRLPLDQSTILSMGTGKLDMRNSSMLDTAAQDNDYYFNLDDDPELSCSEEEESRYASVHEIYHPLVLQFFKEGPLVIQNHRHWSSKTDKIEVPADSRPVTDSYPIGLGSSFSAFASTKESFTGDNRGNTNTASRPITTALSRSVASIISEKSRRPDTTKVNDELFGNYFRHTSSAGLKERVYTNTRDTHVAETEADSWEALEEKYYKQLLDMAKEQDELSRRRQRPSPLTDFHPPAVFSFNPQLSSPLVSRPTSRMVTMNIPDSDKKCVSQSRPTSPSKHSGRRSTYSGSRTVQRSASHRRVMDLETTCRELA